MHKLVFFGGDFFSLFSCPVNACVLFM